METSKYSSTSTQGCRRARGNLHTPCVSCHFLSILFSLAVKKWKHHLENVDVGFAGRCAATLERRADDVSTVANANAKARLIERSASISLVVPS